MMKDLNREGGPRRWSRRDFLRTAAGLAITILLPGCRRRQPTVPTAPAEGGWVETGRYRKDPPWRVGRATRGDMSSWQVMLSAHIEYGVKEKYRQYFHDYHSVGALWDPNKQILDIQNLLGEGIDVLLIDPMEDALVATGVEQAMQAGVPVIYVSSGGQNAPYVSWVTTDEEERGALSADWLCQRVASGRVIVLRSVPPPGDGELWIKGVRGRLETCPGLEAQEVVSFWSSAEAGKAMAVALAESPSVQGVIVDSGPAGQGAIEALSELGIAIPPIAGADDCNGWLRAARARNARFMGFGGSTRLGLRCVELAVDVLSGRPVLAHEEFPYQVFDETAIDRYYRSDLSDHFWAIHDLPETWIQRMFKS